jgi:hypothetical protein
MIVFSYVRLLTSADKDSLTLLALMTTAASYIYTRSADKNTS